MQIINLDVTTREKKGSKKSRSMRRAGVIPAVVYGHGMTPISLEVVKRNLQNTMNTKSGSNVIVNLQLAGASLKESTCLIKDVQYNPVTDEINHVDFTVISMTEKIQVEVPLEILNAEDAPGVKEGGVLDVMHHAIKIECLPTQIPEAIVIDAKGMKINDLVHASELQLPEGVVCLLEADEVVCGVHAVKEEKAAEVTEEGAAAEPVVAEKGKKPAEGEEAAAGAAKKPEAKK
jgi:large subunit ribosomal protein L25